MRKPSSAADSERQGRYLRRGEDRFQLVVAGVNDGVWDWDLVQNRLYFSDRLKAILGYEDLSNEPEAGQWMRRIHPDDQRSVARAMAAFVLGQADQFEHEHRLRHKDGSFRWVLLRGLLVRDQSGKPCRMAGSLTDITERRRVEENLRTSEERFRELVEDLNDVIFSMDAAGTITYISPVIEQVGGYSATELVGRIFTDFVHPDDLNRAVSSLERTMHGVLEPLDFRVLHRDGSVRWVRTSSRAVLDGDAVVEIRGVLTDITDQKRAETALAESERRFRALIEQSSDLISLIGSDGTFSYLGPSVTRILGYQPEEMVGRDALETVHPDDRDEAVQKLADLINHPGASAIAISRCRHKDGSWRWLEAIGTNLLSEPAVGAIIVNSRDITERMRAEADLRESEERLRTIFDEGPLGMAIVGSDNRLLRVNNTLCEIIGYSREELIGRAFPDITHPDDVDTDLELARKLFSGEIPTYQLEKRYIRRDGKVVWASLTTSVVRDAQGAPLYGIGMVQNITDRRSAEAEAQERLAELAHVLRVATVNEMAAVLAHELNQPLAAITNFARGSVHRLQITPVDIASVTEAQGHIVNEALRAAVVIRQLRQFLRKERPHRLPLDLNHLISGVADLLRAEARSHHVVIHLDLSTELPQVQADRIQIEQVALNLIRNGFEAMNDDSVRRELHVRTHLANPDLVEVAVRDTGAGLPQEPAESVFTPFFTTKPGGLGMGLSISRLIVEAHGGHLWAESNGRPGATFRFTLPLTPAATQAMGEVRNPGSS